MGVYVKQTAIPDMDELPKTCADCPLFGYDPWFEWDDNGRPELGAHRCNITGKRIDNTKREVHCPLRESHVNPKDGWTEANLANAWNMRGGE